MHNIHSYYIIHVLKKSFRFANNFPIKTSQHLHLLLQNHIQYVALANIRFYMSSIKNNLKGGSLLHT